MLPSLDDSKSAYAEQRLRDEQEIWITTIRRDGQPQASPVGFLWNGADILILSQPSSQKVRNLSANPRVALHLDIDRHAQSGGGVVTLEGLAAIDPNPLRADEAARYVEKYQDVLRDAELTPTELFADYSAVIRVKPTRSRTY
jgi:PPOX class probable F420-dependent enzyme